MSELKMKSKEKQSWFRRFVKNVKRYPELYLMILPFLVFLILFRYGPIYGVQIAFRDYNPALGYWKSEWVGLKHFKNFLSLPTAGTYIRNTLRISLASLVFYFPLPIILAIMFHQVQHQRYKKVAQTISYIPNFISTVVVVGMLGIFLNSQVGIFNRVREMLGLNRIDYMNRADTFLPVYIISNIWSGLGWGTIIYTGALTTVNPELYEAARIDGASRFKQIWYIELPSILPLISVMLILNIGGLMSVGWEKVYLMQRPLNLSVSEIITTYTYKTGILSTQFSYSAAIGVFNSVINIILLLIANFTVSRLNDSSLF